MTDQDTTASAPDGHPWAEVVPLDEPSMEDYGDPEFPLVDEFGAPPVKPVKVIDGVQDSTAHRGRKS